MRSLLFGVYGSFENSSPSMVQSNLSRCAVELRGMEPMAPVAEGLEHRGRTCDLPDVAGFRDGGYLCFLHLSRQTELICAQTPLQIHGS